MITDDKKSPNPFAKDATYETIVTAIKASEQVITNSFLLPPNTPLTYASLFGMGVGRRAVALSSGFRAMVEQCNSLCAIPIVRMQLDTAIRFYAGFFVEDHQQFCCDVLDGKQINKIRSDEGELMRDKYLVEHVSMIYPWIQGVYDETCGYVHFSNHNIQEAIQIHKTAHGEMISLRDFHRNPIDFLEPMQCMLRLNGIIKTALRYWFEKMSDPDGIKISASELLGGIDQQARDKPC
jgi:hypothetical protein